jgi:hypothetical protein
LRRVGRLNSGVIWQKARPHNAATIAVQSNALKSWKPVENVRHPLWKNLRRYIRNLDVAAVKAKAAADGPWR